MATETKTPDRFVWERAIRSSTLPSSPRLVAYTLATYVDRRTGRAHPGLELLVAGTGLSNYTVRRSLAALRDGGWLVRTVSGTSMGRRRMSDEHLLSLPSPNDGSPLMASRDSEVNVRDDGSGTPLTTSGDETWNSAHHESISASHAPNSAHGAPISARGEHPSSSDHEVHQVRSGDDDRPDDLASKIAEEQGWTVEHAQRVIRDVLDRAPSNVWSPGSYVRKAITEDTEGRYKPVQVAGSYWVDGCDDCDHGWLPRNEWGRVGKCMPCFEKAEWMPKVEGWTR